MDSILIKSSDILEHGYLLPVFAFISTLAKWKQQLCLEFTFPIVANKLTLACFVSFRDSARTRHVQVTSVELSSTTPGAFIPVASNDGKALLKARHLARFRRDQWCAWSEPVISRLCGSSASLMRGV